MIFGDEPSGSRICSQSTNLAYKTGCQGNYSSVLNRVFQIHMQVP